MGTITTVSKRAVFAQLTEWQENNPLRLWRKSQSPVISFRTLAALVKANPSSVCDWEKGSAIPSFESMGKIFRATGGAVTRDAWDSWVHAKPDA